MKTTQLLIRALISAVLFAPALCMAWGAVAANLQGATFTATGHGSAEEAKRAAVEGCQKQGGLICELMFEPANRGAFVVYAAPGAAQAAFSLNPIEANKLAKGGCAKRTKGCTLVTAAWDEGASWMAVAFGPQDYRIRYDSASAKDAEEWAMAECRKANEQPEQCFLIGKGAIDGHAAVASPKSANWLVQVALHPNLEKAKKDALTACVDLDGIPDDCELIQVVSNRPPMEMPQALKDLKQQVEANRKKEAALADQPQPKRVATRSATTETFSCKTRCTNASCTSTFPDGKVTRWTAQRKFDGSNWVYDTTTCGR